MSLFDYKKRKELLANNRKALSNEEWANYLYIAYPAWWDKLYKNIWFFTILYYPPNASSFTPSCIAYPFQSNRFSSMKKIRHEFNAFISQQHLTIKLCFGEDIYEILKNYLPQISNLHDNYFYVHRYLPSYPDDKNLSFNRYKLKDDLLLNGLMADLHYQDNSIINLRIRAHKFRENSNNLKKKFYLIESPHINF